MILLDTHVWLWLLHNPSKLSNQAQAAIDSEESQNKTIGIASTQLPGTFHKDPADRILVAIANRYGIPLVTRDANILNYPHVQTIW